MRNRKYKTLLSLLLALGLALSLSLTALAADEIIHDDNHTAENGWTCAFTDAVYDTEPSCGSEDPEHVHDPAACYALVSEGYWNCSYTEPEPPLTTVKPESFAEGIAYFPGGVTTYCFQPSLRNPMNDTEYVLGTYTLGDPTAEQLLRLFAAGPDVDAFGFLELYHGENATTFSGQFALKGLIANYFEPHPNYSHDAYCAALYDYAFNNVLPAGYDYTDTSEVALSGAGADGVLTLIETAYNSGVYTAKTTLTAKANPNVRFAFAAVPGLTVTNAAGETVAGALPLGEELTFTFTRTADVTAPGDLTLNYQSGWSMNEIQQYSPVDGSYQIMVGATGAKLFDSTSFRFALQDQPGDDPGTDPGPGPSPDGGDPSGPSADPAPGPSTEPSDAPVVEIPDEDVPEAEAPVEIPDEDMPETEVPVEIPDQQVPLGDAPQTGDSELLLIFSALAVISGILLVVLVAAEYHTKRSSKRY